MDAQIEKVIADVGIAHKCFSSQEPLQVVMMTDQVEEMLRELAQRVGVICAKIAFEADTNYDAEHQILQAVRSLADGQKGKTT